MTTQPDAKFTILSEGGVPPGLLAILGGINFDPYHSSPTRIRAHQEPDGRVFVQWQVWRKDSYTGEMAWGAGGKAYVSEHAIESEVVQMIFGLARSYEEHEMREAFMYKGKRVFGPHIDINALLSVADQTVTRAKLHPEDHRA